MFIPLKMVLIGIDPYPYKPPLICFFPISSYGFSHEKPRDFPIKNTMIRDPSQVPRSVVIHPTVASMATRPCFSSAWSELGELGGDKTWWLTYPSEKYGSYMVNIWFIYG